MLADAQGAIQKHGDVSSMSDAPTYGPDDYLLGAGLIGSGAATLGSALAIGYGTIRAYGSHVAAQTFLMGSLGTGYLYLHHLTLTMQLGGFAVAGAATGGYMLGSGINQVVPSLRSGAFGRGVYDFFYPAR